MSESRDKMLFELIKSKVLHCELKLLLTMSLRLFGVNVNIS